MDKTLGKEMVATWNYNREYEGIEISFDGKPSEEIRTKMKGAGFCWSSRQMKWYAKDTAQSRKVASEIATQGEDVGESLTFEQKMQRDKERTEQRQERLGAKAEKLENKSEALLDQAHKMADVIPFGQPILVGHHSEGRDRRYRDKIHNKFGKGFELQDEAKAVEQRLEGSQALARKRETPGYMSRKIDKLEADLRKFEREKEQWKTAMPEWEKRTDKLKEEIAYWKKELGEVGGLMVTSADVRVGDEVFYSGTGRWYEVIRVNPKSVTIKNWHDVPKATWIAEYSKVKEVRHKSYETPLEPKTKIPDAEYEKAKLFLSALATVRTIDELTGWQPAVKRWSIKFPELEKELESEYQARFDYLKAAKDVSEAQRKEKASKPQSDQAKDLYKQMRKTNSVQELDDWRNRVLFEAHLPDVEEDILLRELAAKWRVYLETRGIPALEKLDKLPLDYKNEDYYFGTEVWIHPTTTIFDDRPQKGILHFARNEGELFDVMLEGVPGTTRVQISRIYVTKLVEKSEPRYQAPVKKTYRYASFNRPLWNGFDPGVPYNIVEIQKSDYLNDRKPHDVIETHTPISLEHIKNLELIDYAEVEEKNKLYSYAKTVFSAGPHLNQINDLIRSKKITTTEKIDEYKAKLDKQKSEREKEKDLLKAKYPDYDPKRHDAFVMKYNKEKEAEKLEQFMVNRGIIEWTPQQAIKLAADTVETLRKPDVFRVLSQNKSHAKELGAFIKSKRADLANEVEKILFEFTLPTYELYFWRLTHTPHLKEKWHIEYKVAEISDNKRREFSSFGSRYFETWEEIRNILASGTVNLWVHDVRGDHTVTFKPIILELPRTLDRIGKSYINGKFITQLIQPSYTYPDGMWGWSVQHEMMENGRLQSAGREIIAESVIENLPEFTDAMRNEAIIREALKSYDLSVPKDKIGRAGFILDVFPREYVPMLAKLDKVARQELEPKLMQLIQAAKDELNKPNIPVIEKTDEGRFKELKNRFTSYQFNIGSPEMKELTELERKLKKEKPKFTIENPFGVDLSKSVVPYPEQPELRIDILKRLKEAQTVIELQVLIREIKESTVFSQTEKYELISMAENMMSAMGVEYKPKVFGESKQKQVERGLRAKAAQGKRLKGQQTLFSAVSTSTRLTQFEEKPRRAEPLKFKRPIPLIGRMRSPPYPFIRPKPKLLAMPSEKDIQKVKQSKEAELHTRLMLIAEKTRLKREQNQLKKEVE